MKVYKITQDDGTPLITDTLIKVEDILGTIEYCEVGDKYEVEVIEMSQQEYDDLPEWGGF